VRIMPSKNNNHQASLMLHLPLMMLPLMASYVALRQSKSDLPFLNDLSPGIMPEPLANLQKAWRELKNNPNLAVAVHEEAKNRLIDLLSTVEKYRQSEFTRNVTGEPQIVCNIGNARLLDYGATHQETSVVLLVPSLINRYYILDLSEKRSFARYLRNCGFRVFIVDWQSPGELENNFNCSQYITEILVPFAEFICQNTSGKINISGYCMGGLFAVAAAQIRPDLFDSLALFATPWNFFSENFPHFAMNEGEIAALGEYIDNSQGLSPENINLLFHYANPYAFRDKLREFDYNARNSDEDFAAIEHWSNDGVAMSKAVARDCLINWTQYNSPAAGKWRVGGQIVDAEKLDLPCFAAIPKEDKIVPSDCALPLAELLKDCTIVMPHSGHVGMMIGKNGKTSTWESFAKWLRQ